MSKSLQVFQNNLFGKVKVLEKNGELWFSLVEISKVLGFRDPYSAARGLDDDEKLLHIFRVAGQERVVTLASESGFYSLILKSRKPEAKAFKKWVTSEVLPSIRKTGKYKIPKKLQVDSKDTRNSLTDNWKDHGVEKSYHYINLTKEEYKTLFGDRNKKKAQMNKEEILKLKAFEALESFKMLGSTANGYYDCKDSIHSTGKFLENFKTAQITEGE